MTPANRTTPYLIKRTAMPPSRAALSLCWSLFFEMVLRYTFHECFKISVLESRKLGAYSA